MFFTTLTLLLAVLSPGQAQQVVPLVDRFTHVWRYDDSGRDLGTAWRTNTYDDSAWLTGMGLFGVEPGVPFPYAAAGFSAMDVPLVLTPPGSNSQTVTYYFRTHFDVPATNLPGLMLESTNFLDDAAVIYLNGIEAARFRLPANPGFRTLATGLTTEGRADVTNVPAALLRTGDNVLAVEVHQSSTPSLDVAFAMSLTALVPETLVLTHPPQSRTNVVGARTTFEVGVNGSPATYQWLKDGAPILGARTNTYTISQLQMSHAGRYSVEVTNAASRVVSPEAVLTVVPDTFGPKLVSAVVSEAGLTNRIIVGFSEQLLVSTATNRDNYRITRLANNVRVGISNIAYAPFPASQALLIVGGPDWVIGDDYVLTANGLRDFTASNSIAPDSQIGISWPQTLPVLDPDHVWDFHTAAVFDPDVFSSPWWAVDYTPGFWWARGPGLFQAGPVFAAPCFGQFQTEIGFQYEPSLFRTTFQYEPPLSRTAFPAPGELGANLRLRVAFVANDGMVLYLNGSELLRTNAPAGPIHAGTTANASVNGMICSTQIVAAPNLVRGANSLAAAVFQANPAAGDTVFGLKVDALYERTVPAPAGPTPKLRLTALEGGVLEISWSGAGYALEGSSTLNDTNSAPHGPWTEIADMTNPIRIEATSTHRFYRLRK